MTETQLQDAIIGRRGLARILGWRVTHSRPAMIKDPSSIDGYSWRTAIQGDAGFPDVVLTKSGRLIFAEFKSEGKLPTLEQALWLDLLCMVEVVETYLWYPSDTEEIKEILTLGHVPNLGERLSWKSTWRLSYTK